MRIHSQIPSEPTDLLAEDLPSRPVTWDPAYALEKLGGDEKLLREIVQIFVEESPKLVANLKEALSAGNSELLERTAHSLKGELGYLGISSLSQKARELEELGRKPDLARAAEVLPALEAELAQLMTAMRTEGAHNETPDR